MMSGKPEPKTTYVKREKQEHVSSQPAQELLVWVTETLPQCLDKEAVRQEAVKKYVSQGLTAEYINNVVNTEYASGLVREISEKKGDMFKLNKEINDLIYGEPLTGAGKEIGGLKYHEKAIADVEQELAEKQKQLIDLEGELDDAIEKDKIKKDKEKIARQKTELDAMETKYKTKEQKLEEDYKNKAKNLGDNYNKLVTDIKMKQNVLDKMRDNFKKVAGQLDEKWQAAEKVKSDLAAKEEEVRKLLPSTIQTVKQIYKEADENTRKGYERLLFYSENQIQLREKEIERNAEEYKLKEEDLKTRLEKERKEKEIYEKEVTRFQENVRGLKRFFPDIKFDEKWDSHDYLYNMGYVVRMLDKRLTMQEMRIRGHMERENAMLGIIDTLSGELTDTGRILVRYAVQVSLPGREAIQRYVLAQIDENKFTDAKRFLSEMKVPMELVSRVNETVTVIDKYEGIQSKKKKDLRKMLPPMPEEQQKAVVIEEDPPKPED
jgi:hypothetical protein